MEDDHSRYHIDQTERAHLRRTACGEGNAGAGEILRRGGGEPLLYPRILRVPGCQRAGALQSNVIKIKALDEGGLI